MARGGSRLGGDALLRKTFKKKRKKGRKKRKERKKERGKISHLFSVSGRDTEEERLVLYIYIYLYLYLYLYMYTQPRHYGVLDASCTVCGQTKADNAHWERINSSASGLLKQEFGGEQPASGRSHVAASLCSKVTVVAKRLLISAPEVSHPVLLLLLLLLLLRRFQHATTSLSDDLHRSRAAMGVHHLIHAISTINNLIYLLQSWRDIPEKLLSFFFSFFFFLFFFFLLLVCVCVPGERIYNREEQYRA